MPNHQYGIGQCAQTWAIVSCSRFWKNYTPPPLFHPPGVRLNAVVAGTRELLRGGAWVKRQWLWVGVVGWQLFNFLTGSVTAAPLGLCHQKLW